MNTEIRFVLCLSGGGFRAALFHVGVIRRLIYLNLFDQVKRINSVSGGSIIAGLIMKELTQGGRFLDVADFDKRVVRPFVDFIQTSPRRKLSTFPLRVNPFKFSAYLEDHLYGHLSFNKLAESPTWFCYATSLDSGKQWRFTQQQIGDSKIGFTNPQDSDRISTGVAASACYTPYFKPMMLDISTKQFKLDYANGKRVDAPNPSAPLRVHLADGGLYDNLAVESVALSGNDKRPVRIIVSDASGVTPHWRHGIPNDVLSKAKRPIDVTLNQMNKLMRLHVFNKIRLGDGHTMVEAMKPLSQYTDFTPEGMVSPTHPSDMPKYFSLGYNMEHALGLLRTDLDAFHDAEIHLLIWNGMAKIDAVLKRWNPQYVDRVFKSDVPPLNLDNSQDYYNVIILGHKIKIIGKLHKDLHFHGTNKLRDEITIRFGTRETNPTKVVAAQEGIH